MFIYLLLILFGIYILFLLGVLTGILLLRKIKTIHLYPSISIIIPFRDEEFNLKDNIESLLKQTYTGNYEILYINDHSSDKSVEIVSSQTDSRIRLISLVNGSGKKDAITLGINESKYDIIALTDADCLYENEWLSSMAGCYNKGTGMIAGSVNFFSDDGTFQNLQQLEFASLITVGAGLIGIKRPIICNSANLFFEKDAFYTVGGYNDFNNIASGDDVFLMQKMHKFNYKIVYSTSKDSIVYTNPKDTVSDFFNQRKRWAGKSIHYPSISILITLALIFLFYLMFFISPFVLWNKFLILLLIYSVKSLIEYLVLFIGRLKLSLDFSFKQFKLAEFLYIPYILYSTIGGIAGRFKWK